MSVPLKHYVTLNHIHIVYIINFCCMTISSNIGHYKILTIYLHSQGSWVWLASKLPSFQPPVASSQLGRGAPPLPLYLSLFSQPLLFAHHSFHCRIYKEKQCYLACKFRSSEIKSSRINGGGKGKPNLKVWCLERTYECNDDTTVSQTLWVRKDSSWKMTQYTSKWWRRMERLQGSEDIIVTS